MSQISFDLNKLYQQTFGGKPYVLGKEEFQSESNPFVIDGKRKQQVSQVSGSQLIDTYREKEIWLPVKFDGFNPNEFEGLTEIFLPYSVIKISAKKTIIKTSLTERKGTVKEVFNIADYSISIKGFVIDEDNRIWPEKELIVLKKLFELNESIRLNNALTNIFLDKSDRVTISSLDILEVQGGRKHVRPFSMSIESDSVFVLEEQS